MIKIGAVSADWDSLGRPGGAGTARIHRPLLALKAAGYEVEISNEVGHHRDGWMVPTKDGAPMMDRPDIIVLQRWMHENAPTAIHRAREAGQVVINDVDDWFDGLDPKNKAFYTTHPKVHPDSNRDHYRRALAASTMITVSTEYLAQRLRHLGAPVTVLRNTVDLTEFVVQPVRPTTEDLVVGWVGALGWRSGDLEILRGTLGPWLREHGALFVHNGASPGDAAPAWELLGLEEDQVQGWRPMVPSGEYGRALVRGFDIGIVPLASVPFNEAKSSIKAMEYAAAGIPAVTSDTAEQRWFNADWVAKRPKDWRRLLDRLVDPEVRAAASDATLTVG